VGPEWLGDYPRDYCALVERFGYHRFRRFIEEAGDLVVSYGGSLSGEHGDGQLRANQLGKMFGPELL
jgi:FAD/FMN-containing dehydrogenase